MEAMPNMDPNDRTTRAGQMVAAVISCTTIAIIIVALRLYTRIRIVRHPGWEDLVIVLAMCSSIVMGSMMLGQAAHGMGRHMWTLSNEELQKGLMLLYYSIPPYFLTLNLVKISVILQYLRIFSTRKFQIVCNVSLAFITCFAIWVFFNGIFMCTPMAAFWDESIPGGHCVNRLVLWVTWSSISIASDFIIVLMPIPVIASLKLPARQKKILILIFALGGFTSVMGVLRLHSLLVIAKATDPTWENPPAAAWSCIEANVAIITASLPSLRAFITRFFPRILGSSLHRSYLQSTNRRGLSGGVELGTKNTDREEMWHSDEGSDRMGTISTAKGPSDVKASPSSSDTDSIDRGYEPTEKQSRVKVNTQRLPDLRGIKVTTQLQQEFE